MKWLFCMMVLALPACKTIAPRSQLEPYGSGEAERPLALTVCSVADHGGQCPMDILLSNNPLQIAQYWSRCDSSAWIWTTYRPRLSQEPFG